MTMTTLKLRNIGAVLFFLSIAQPICAQTTGRPVHVEAGIVMGIIAEPYATVALVPGPWSIRLSGGGEHEFADCHGLQLNVGRVLRDEENAKHAISAMWGEFRSDCWNGSSYPQYRQRGGQYLGVAYDFQVKGFLVEVGPAFGAKNPFLSIGRGPFSHWYGQVGYVYRFGKKYE